MSPRNLIVGLLGLALAVLLVVGLIQLGDSSSTNTAGKLTAAQTNAALAGSPAPLAALHAEADEIIGGGLPALRARLAQLRGRPLVINKWASWCEPCRAEFGVFQRVAVTRGREVAFIGIDSGDHRGNAATFLRAFPVSYPSYFDPSGQAGSAVTDSSFTPVTVFYDRGGSEYIHQGPYLSVSKLEQDIRRYALGA